MKLTDTDIENLLAEMKPTSLTEKQLSRMESAMTHCQDSVELRALEADLASLEPIDLDEDLAERMESVMDLTRIESYLEGFTATEMPSDLLSRMEGAMENWQKEEQPNVVEFSPAKKEDKKFSLSHLWSSVAAVAVLVGVGAVLSSGEDVAPSGDGPAVVADITEEPLKPFEVSQELPLGERSSNIINASNEGVVTKDQKPYQKVVVRYEIITIVYKKDGSVLEVRVPKEKVVYLPVKTN